MSMSQAYEDNRNPLSDEESTAAIHKALELGVTFIDTSDVYGPFTNEVLVGTHCRLPICIRLISACAVWPCSPCKQHICQHVAAT